MSRPKEDISPEERLLRIIKGQPKKESLKDTDPAGPKIKPVPGEPEVVTKPVRRAAIHREPFGLAATLQRINTVIFIIWCLLTAGLFIFIKNISSPAQRHIARQNGQGVLQSGEDSGVDKISLKPLSDYSAIINKRDIFKVYEGHVKPQAPAAQVAPSDLLGNYVLSGVIGGDNPQAIIEDKKSKSVYFLNKEQYLGNFKIEDIREGKVILELRGERFELSL